MKTNVKMKCSNCGSELDVDSLLVSQFEASIRKELQLELHRKEKEFHQQLEEYRLLTEKLNQDKEDFDTLVDKRVKSITAKYQEEIKASIIKEVTDEKSEQLQALENELLRKSKLLREHNATKAQLVALQRSLEEAETRIVLEKEKELTERLEQAKLSIKEQAQQESFLKIREREKVIEDLKLKLDEAKRQAEVGSQQLMGEVQELEIIDMLKEIHRTDRITQSKKGSNAADVLQIVMTENGGECGSIYYESKRTKTFSNAWVKKFKQDNIETKADILVLVTNALPRHIKRYGIVEGVWLCSFNDVKELSLALRFGLLKLQQVVIASEGKETKVELLYQYLTSQDFKNVFSSIIDGFAAIQNSHNSEKARMQRLWAERQKIIETTLANAINFYGSIKGIAGESIPEIKMLELKHAS